MGGDRTTESTTTDETDETGETSENRLKLPGETYDDSAEEFLELEAALSRADGAASVLEDATTTGVVMDAERVTPASVPDAYPVDIRTTTALAFTVLLSTDREITVYTEWPDHVTDDDPLVKLLARLDIRPSRFADIAGEEVPLERIGGRYILDLPGRARTSERSPYWVWGIVAGLLFWIMVWLLPTNIIGGGVTLLVWVLLPILTYFDMRYVDDVSEWSPRWYLWVLLAVIWVINIPAGMLYLGKRIHELGPFWR